VRSSVRVQALGYRHVLSDGAPALEVPFILKFTGKPVDSVVAAEPRVAVLDGSYESDPPAGADVPRVLFWKSPQGEIVREPELTVRGGSDGEWRVIVSLPPDAAVSVGLSVRGI
jgi:hypothetical protein